MKPVHSLLSTLSFIKSLRLEVKAITTGLAVIRQVLSEIAKYSSLNYKSQSITSPLLISICSLNISFEVD
jgi:hypothetical protein